MNTNLKKSLTNDQKELIEKLMTIHGALVSRKQIIVYAKNNSETVKQFPWWLLRLKSFRVSRGCYNLNDILLADSNLLTA